MTKPTLPITESALNLDLNEQSHDLVRELAMACRKMSIYGADHPLSVKAIEKPFLLFSKIFRYKTCVTLNVLRGQLYLHNIRLKDTPFNGQILQFLQLLDVNAVLYRTDMTARDLAFFIESLVTRQRHYDPNFNLGAYLNEHSIDTIAVNSELAFDLFETRKQYRGDVSSDFSIRRMALDQLGDDPVRLAHIRNANTQGLLEQGIDFEPAVVRYLLPEKVASLSAEHIRRVLTDLAGELSAGNLGPQKAEQTTVDYMAIFRLVETHPQKDKILENLEDRRAKREAKEDADPLTETGAIKIHASTKARQLLDGLFASPDTDAKVDEFADTFSRLLKTGQQPRAIEIMRRLLEQMGSSDPAHRQKALTLAINAMEPVRQVAFAELCEATVDNVVERLNAKSETFEYSEFLWVLFDTCHHQQGYALMARLTQAMARRRQIAENVTIYDSMAIKKGFENISRKPTVDRLIAELVDATPEQGRYLKEILEAIGSEEIALALSRIISHPQRNVRQLVLKILAELGKASLKVFSRILLDDSMFVRDEGHFELPDEKWYVVRNSIFVLGSLRDQQGVPALRSRISDSDIRVRREIVAALERIGGEEAVDCLTLMAEDPHREVRQAAVIAIGLVGGPEAAPILIDIARRSPLDSVRAVSALGKAGGNEARKFLGDLLADTEQLARLAAGRIPKEELRLAVVRALGQIGDPEAIGRIREFKDRQSATSKILFKNSSVNKAITDILSRQK